MFAEIKLRKSQEKLPNSFAIFFDDFDECDDPTIHPTDLYQWALDGGDANAWQTAGIIAKLNALKKNQEYDFVVFDAPLGRAHEDSGRFIDLMVFIDTPLEASIRGLATWPP
jgi:uridine kinase